MKLSEKMLDLMFWFTTCGGRTELRRLESMHRSPVCPPGWTARAAGPRWFLIWSRNTALLIRLRVIVLPRRWMGLSRTESLALVSDQLARIEADGPGPGASRVLRDAQHRIGRMLARGW